MLNGGSWWLLCSLLALVKFIKNKCTTASQERWRRTAYQSHNSRCINDSCLQLSIENNTNALKSILSCYIKMRSRRFSLYVPVHSIYCAFGGLQQYVQCWDQSCLVFGLFEKIACTWHDVDESVLVSYVSEGKKTTATTNQMGKNKTNAVFILFQNFVYRFKYFFLNKLSLWRMHICENNAKHFNIIHNKWKEKWKIVSF